MTDAFWELQSCTNLAETLFFSRLLCILSRMNFLDYENLVKENPDMARLGTLQAEMLSRLEEYESIVRQTVTQLKSKYLWRLVKFPNKGWNKGYIVEINVSPSRLYMLRENLSEISFRVAPQKDSPSSLQRYTTGKDIELLSQEEADAYENTVRLHKAISARR